MYFLPTSIWQSSYIFTAQSKVIIPEEEIATTTLPVVEHVKTPEAVKAIYMTSCVVGTPSLRQKLVDLINTTELNSIIIDIKDFSGTLSYNPTNPDLKHAWDASKCGTKDMKDFVEALHKDNIYVIGRVTVFQDPHFVKLHPELAVKSLATGQPWKDKKGLSFLDVGGKATWNYVIAIANDAHSIGFDEINFDYIRFPSDGNMKDTVYTLSGLDKAAQLEKFFSYLSGEMKKSDIITSADLFGMTTTNTDDLNIGQVLERTLPYFDYVAPMVYPSHYPTGFNGWKNPNDQTYDLIYFVLKKGAERAMATTTTVSTLTNERIGTSTPAIYTHEAVNPNKIRPWLQDFDYGGNYGPVEVKNQINATYEAGLNSWMLWAPSNVYTKEALLAE
ncbi:MAG: putative glycoside hydrolase [Minisyncoccia bacterium]